MVTLNDFSRYLACFVHLLLVFFLEPAGGAAKTLGPAGGPTAACAPAWLRGGGACAQAVARRRW
eukprot:8296752-Lingulodinium_polyedra.AAC.1